MKITQWALWTGILSLLFPLASYAGPIGGTGGYDPFDFSTTLTVAEDFLGGATTQLYGSTNTLINFGPVLYLVDGVNGAGTVAQFVSDCSAAGVPRACCTGNGTGSGCPAIMPASLGTLTAAGATSAAFLIAR